MPYFGLYLDIPPDGNEPSDEIILKVQSHIEEAHGGWTVYFNYTRTPSSNAPHYVGVSVNGTTERDVQSPDFRNEIEAEIRELVEEVDDDREIEVGKVRYTWWY